MLGVAIIAGATFVKVPQIRALAVSRSAAGLSALSFELENIGYTIHASYGFLLGLPFNAYGEAGIMLLQVAFLTACSTIVSGSCCVVSPVCFIDSYYMLYICYVCYKLMILLPPEHAAAGSGVPLRAGERQPRPQCGCCQRRHHRCGRHRCAGTGCKSDLVSGVSQLLAQLWISEWLIDGLCQIRRIRPNMSDPSTFCFDKSGPYTRPNSSCKSSACNMFLCVSMRSTSNIGEPRVSVFMILASY